MVALMGSGLGENGDIRDGNAWLANDLESLSHIKRQNDHGIGLWRSQTQI